VEPEQTTQQQRACHTASCQSLMEARGLARSTDINKTGLLDSSIRHHARINLSVKLFYGNWSMT
jgi:hypothetical protein